MTPHFAIFCWNSCPRSDVLPQNISFFSDFGTDLRQKRAFSGKVCSLEVATNFERLQFTFSSLVGPGRPSRDTGQWLLSAQIYLLEYIWPKSCRFMEHTHLLSPHKKFQLHSVHLCRENDFLVRQLLIGHPAALCRQANSKSETMQIRQANRQVEDANQTGK